MGKHAFLTASFLCLAKSLLVNIAGTNPNSVESSVLGKTYKNCMTCGKGNHCYDLSIGFMY